MAVDLSNLTNKATLAGTEQIILNDAGIAKDVTVNVLKAHVSASPTLTGVPVAPTAAAGSNTTQIATTAYVLAERSTEATLINKTLTDVNLSTEAVNVVANNLPATKPTLILDFANSQSVDPRITFTRASTATRVNSKGLIEVVPSGVPRIDYDPVTGECKGLLIEEARVNQLLNSTIDGANLATQNVTVAAVGQTLSFCGTGTVTLSGAYVGVLVGAGAYPARSTLTFTPAAGTLTVTVSGTVQFANLEIGAGGGGALFATSFIPTAASAVTRAADVAVMTGANFSSWYRQDEGAFAVTATPQTATAALIQPLVQADDGAANARHFIYRLSTSNLMQLSTFNEGEAQAIFNTPALVGGSTGMFAYAYKTDSFAGGANGGATLTDNTGTVPAVTQFRIGSDVNPRFLNGHIKRISYYPKRLTNAQIQSLFTP